MVFLELEAGSEALAGWLAAFIKCQGGGPAGSFGFIAALFSVGTEAASTAAPGTGGGGGGGGKILEPKPVLGKIGGGTGGNAGAFVVLGTTGGGGNVPASAAVTGEEDASLAVATSVGAALGSEAPADAASTVGAAAADLSWAIIWG